VIAPLAPLVPSAIRARRRPVAIVAVYLAELVWSLVIASPVHAWARAVYGAHPAGDAVLWAPGGRELLAWVGDANSALPILSRTTLILLVVGMLAMQVPLGALVVSLGFARGTEASGSAAPRWRSAIAVGTSAFWGLAGLLVLGGLTSLVVFAIGTMVGAAVDSGVSASLGDARAFQLRLVVIGLFTLLCCVIGVIVDLARVSVARETALTAIRGTALSGWTMMLRGLRWGFRAFRRHAGRALLAWGWRAVLSLALIAVGYFVAAAIGGKGGALLLVLWLVHQGIVLVRVALRASWLARALAYVAPVQDEPDAATDPLPEPEATSAAAGAS
jgi:hypothetical protein